MAVIDSFGVNIQGLDMVTALNSRFAMAMEKAIKSKKPFRATLEYNPERRHMALFTIEEINEDGHTDEPGNGQEFDTAGGGLQQ